MCVVCMFVRIYIYVCGIEAHMLCTKRARALAATLMLETSYRLRAAAAAYVCAAGFDRDSPVQRICICTYTCTTTLYAMVMLAYARVCV